MQLRTECEWPFERLGRRGNRLEKLKDEADNEHIGIEEHKCDCSAVQWAQGKRVFPHALMRMIEDGAIQVGKKRNFSSQRTDFKFNFSQKAVVR